MKRLSLFFGLLLVLCGAPVARAQDAATEERLNRLSGRIDDLQAAQEALRKQFEHLGKEIESLREQVSRPSGNYASQEDLKTVAEAVKEIDRKRLEDYEKIRSELLKLGKTLAAPATSSRKPAPEAPPREKGGGDEKGFEYVVKSGDTLSSIVQAYREQNIKVSLDQILKANPGLKPEKMHPGQKIFIPAPSGSQ